MAPVSMAWVLCDVRLFQSVVYHRKQQFTLPSCCPLLISPKSRPPKRQLFRPHIVASPSRLESFTTKRVGHFLARFHTKGGLVVPLKHGHLQDASKSLMFTSEKPCCQVIKNHENPKARAHHVDYSSHSAIEHLRPRHKSLRRLNR